MNKKRSLKYLIFVICSLVIIFALVFFFFLKNNNSTFKNLTSIGNLKNNEEFTFYSSDVEDTYQLILDTKLNDYLENSLVELYGGVPIVGYDIKININAYFDLKEMFEKQNYSDLIVRRGFLTDEESNSAGVQDHKTGYDIDIYLKGHDWTDFTGYDETDDIIKNSYKYGYVLRYTTKEKDEPWHYRYIGKVHSNLMHKENLTIDEYLNNLEQLDENILYKIIDSNNYIYKIKKSEVIVPQNYNYSVSSINDDYYIVTFSSEKDCSLEEIVEQETISKNISEVKISNDLIVVNEEHELNNYKPLNLVSLTTYLSDDNNSEYLLEEHVLQKLKNMIDDAKSLDRHTTYVTSAYRSLDEQTEIYNNTEKGYATTPNHSEHQTGLAIDISNSYKDNKYFTQTVQGRWIKDNSYKYGFILRYPSEKNKITGISYEQWHFRYVGELHATVMNANNWVLEEYVDSYEINKFYSTKVNDKEYIIYKTIADDSIQLINENDLVYYLYDNYYLVVSERS